MSAKLFIASSTEGLTVARAIQNNLEYDVFPILWTQGVFKPSEGTLDDLLRELQQADFGLFVFTPDDASSIRGEQVRVPRDNVVFELGMFIGHLGKRRCFVLVPRGIPDLHLPTDLLGLTPVNYDHSRLEENPVAAVGSAANDIRRRIEELGPITKQPTLVPFEDPKAIEIRAIGKIAGKIAAAYGPDAVGIRIQRDFGPEITTRRGDFILNWMVVDEPTPDDALGWLRAAAAEMAREGGDGTKITVMLISKIVSVAYHEFRAGVLISDLISGIDSAVTIATQHLRQLAHGIDSRTIVEVAATAACDYDVGELIGTAMEKAGKDGMISVEWHSGRDVRLEVIDGIQFDRGYVSPDFISDPSSGSAIFEDCYILVYSGKLLFLKPVFRLLQRVVETHRPLLIIAEDIDSEALATLRANHRRGTLLCSPVKAPGFGDRRVELLADIAALTGATVIDDTVGPSLDRATLDDLGRAKRVLVSAKTTTIYDGASNPAKVKERAIQVRARLAEATDDYSREKLIERLARLTAKIVNISVGSPSEVEQDEATRRISNALRAANSASTAGYLAGGGAPLLSAAREIRNVRERSLGRSRGMLAVAEALEAPTRALAKNAQADETAIFREIERFAGPTVGFNAATRQVEDLTAAGVVDSAMILIRAIEIAASHSKHILQSSAETAAAASAVR